MPRSFVLASSAISSSEMMQRRISSCSAFKGSSAVNIASRLSRGASSDFPFEKLFMRFAVSSSEQMRKSSIAESDAPSRRRCSDPFTSVIPESETLPFFKMRVRASFVYICASSIAESSVIGSNARQRLFASAEYACASSLSMILLYSSVVYTF